jgi:hypothetical protein
MTDIQHTILTSCSRECDSLFSQVRFYPIEYLLYPGLKDEEMSSNSSCVIEPDFTFIKSVHISKDIKKSYITTNDGIVIEYRLLTVSLFNYLQKSLILVD